LCSVFCSIGSRLLRLEPTNVVNTVCVLTIVTVQHHLNSGKSNIVFVILNNYKQRSNKEVGIFYTPMCDNTQRNDVADFPSNYSSGSGYVCPIMQNVKQYAFDEDGGWGAGIMCL